MAFSGETARTGPREPWVPPAAHSPLRWPAAHPPPGNDIAPELLCQLSPTQQTLLVLVHPCGQRQVSPQTDWHQLLALAHRLCLVERITALHGVSGEGIWPGEAALDLAEARRSAVARSLLLAHEEANLIACCRQAGIEAIPLKGGSLARILHADPAARFYVDLDLGVPQAGVAPAAVVLRERGYEVSLPAALLRHPGFLRSADQHTAELTATCLRAGATLLVELHWNLLPLEEHLIWSSLSDYNGTPTHVRTFSPTLYLLYLMAHVSGHGWAGLRWLCDVGDFLLRFGGRIEPAEFLARVRSTRLGLRVGVTLELLQAYFGLRWEALDPLRDTRTRRTALRYLLRPIQGDGPRTLGAVHRERMGLLENSRERLRYLGWLMRPTRIEWLQEGPPPRLRPAPAAWLMRAMRLAGLAGRELFGRGRGVA